MLADQFVEAADGARTPATLDDLARKLWRAHAEGHIADVDAGAASEAIEGRRAALSAFSSLASGGRAVSVSGLPRASKHPSPCGDIDAIAHEIAVGLLDHVAVDADAKLDAAILTPSPMRSPSASSSGHRMAALGEEVVSMT
jgi:hypothetical protein